MTFKKSGLFVLAAMIALLPACGKRGNLEYPDNARPNRQYPAPVSPQTTTPAPETASENVADPTENNPAMEMNVLQGLDMPNVTQDVTAPGYNF